MTGSRGGGGQQDKQGLGHAQAHDRWLAVPRTQAEAELRQALDRAAAREADEVALRRVWARVAEPETFAPASGDVNRDSEGKGKGFDGRLARRPRWPWIIAASLAGATAALAFMLVETRSEVRFAVVRKGAPVVAPAVTGANRATPDLGSALVAPATIRTGLGETLHLTLRGGTEVAVTSQSALVLDENDRPSVSTGEVRFHVPPQAPGRTFAVTIGAYRVVVVGTRFRVRVNQGSTVVGVDEGIVEIWNDHRVARIGAGESWASPEAPAAEVQSPPISPPAAPAVVVPPHSAAGKAMRSTRSSRASRTKLAALSLGVSAVPTRANAREPQHALALASPSASSPAPRPALSPSAVAAPVAAPPRVVAPAAPPVSTGDSVGTSVAPAPAASPGLAPPAPAMAPASDSAPLVVQARQARAIGDFRRALDIYRTLSQKSGAAGESAEYEMGRVLRDGLRQPREAVSAWRQYRAHHPRGSLRMEADISVIETLVSIGDKAGALAEASDFIGRYPDSERRLEVARLSGDLLRERGDCTAAIAAYDVAMGSSRSRKDSGKDIADSVSFHRSTCLLRGNHGEGVAALKAYLQSFPWGRFRGEAQRLLSDAQSASAAVVRQ